MTETPLFLTEAPYRAESELDPAGLDVLSDALRIFRVTGTALLRGEFNEPWAIDMPPGSDIAGLLHTSATKIVMFHIVAEGTCWMKIEGQEPFWLEKGDMIGFPHGDQHLMGAGRGVEGVRLSTLLPPPPWTGMPIVRIGGNGPRTLMVCVYLHCDELLFNPILSSLPGQVVVKPHSHAAPWIEASVNHIIAEALGGRPGSSGVLARLTELLFIEILRRYITDANDDATGWLAALGDRNTALALQALHGKPDHRWTVTELANHAALSRSALVDRFHRLLDMPPMSYLTQLRLQLATQALQSTDKPITRIAEDVGYGSEEAFSRAFKRHAGTTPSEWRRSARSLSEGALL